MQVPETPNQCLIVQLDLLVSAGVTGDHLAELEFLGEFAAEMGEVADNILAGLHESLLRGDIAIGLDAKLESCKQWVGNYKILDLA
jgi:hypothetical protein